MSSRDQGSRTRDQGIRLIAFVSIFAATQLTAQQMPQQLTLEDAQRLARLHNPEYKQVENNAITAAAAVRQRYGAFMPSLSSGLSFGGSHGWTQSALDPFGRPISDPRTVETESSSASQSLGMQVTLFDGGAMFRQLAAAKSSQDATDALIANQGNQLRAQVVRDYFAALRTEQAIALEERLLAARKDDLERTQREHAIAVRKYIDVLSAQVQVAGAEQSVDLARGAADKAKLQLKSTIGIEGGGQFTLSSEPPAVFDPASLNGDALVQRALTSSPAVLAANAQVIVADKGTSVARASRFPTISGNMGFGRSTSAQGYGAIGALDLPNRSLNFGVNMSLPIFTRFSTGANIANAEANEADSRQALRRTRLTVERDVRSALVDLHNAYRTVQLNQIKADLSREQLAMAQEEYRRGVTGMDFFRLQQIVNDEARAQRDLLNARFDFITTLANLEERLGGPLER